MTPVFFFAVISLLSCGSSNKKKTISALTPLSTEWSINGTNYKGSKTLRYDTTTRMGTLSSMDSAGNFISVIIFSQPKTSGTYRVSKAGAASDCFIQVGVFKGRELTMYTSVSKEGDYVNITISPNGLIADFNNISVAKDTLTAKVSGSIVQ
jgi:hypothetical protein